MKMFPKFRNPPRLTYQKPKVIKDPYSAEDKAKDIFCGLMEDINEYEDNIYNKKHSTGNKFEKIDKFNNFVDNSLYLADNFTSLPYGHFASNYGRVVRDNYEFQYQRSPFNDKFDRAFDAYKKSTEFDY